MTTTDQRYPDVKTLTPLETQHITAECRDNRGRYPAWDEAVHRLLHVYEAQVHHRPGATVSVAIYVTESTAASTSASDAQAVDRRRCPFCCQRDDGRRIEVLDGVYVHHLTGAGMECSGSGKSLAALPPLPGPPGPSKSPRLPRGWVVG